MDIEGLLLAVRPTSCLVKSRTPASKAIHYERDARMPFASFILS